ncbi:ABC transporter permease [Actinophytocola sp.]|uniref:ABC transporter permease n=1 Tax=Actinophytocola sp. TaxID=1872138 RepID=UPI003D6B97FC
MFGFVARRILATIPILLFVSVATFLLIHLSPGDPAVKAAGGMQATPEAIAIARERLGLNKPLVTQYLDWMSGLVRGDLGRSLFKPMSVSSAIAERFTITLSLTVCAIFIAVVLALVAGLLAASRPDGIVDRIVTPVSSLGIAAPNFFIGMLLVLAFSLHFGWFPAVGYVPFTEDPIEWLRHLALPSFALGVAVAAELARHLRASLRDVLQTDYVRTAVAKGLRARSVLTKHALKNAGIPVITVLGIHIGHLLGGTVVIESVFGIQGLGSLAVTAVFDRDYTMIQGITIVTVLFVVVVNLLVDLSYAVLNPRVRPH